MPPAVRIRPSPAIASVVTPTIMPGRHAGHHRRVAGLADAGDAAALDADVGLADAGPVDDQRVGDDAVERLGVGDARPPGPARRAAPCRRRTCTRRRSAWRRARPRRRGRCRRGARCRPSSGRRCRRSAGARCGAAWWASDEVRVSTRRTVLVSPGSNRTAVPAGMSRRLPRGPGAIEIERRGWSRRTGSGCRPGSAGRRGWSPAAR